ncbi:MAG: putative dehydrogenase [Myxococcaceae bacterium]|nr:putative dehydrogenase [Myxococcaceae bacterium]
MEAYDAVVVGSGPNGLAAAIRLAQAGMSTLLVEAAERVGGGLRTEALTIPGFRHDYCAAIHTMGVLSPYFTKLPLAEHGLTWAYPEASVAHPLDDRPAAMLEHSLPETASLLGRDARSYTRLLAPFLKNPLGLLGDLLGPLGIPSHPLAMMRFGFYALRPATWLARRFDTVEARALFGGCAAHSILPFTHWGTAAFGMMFLLTGHIERWPAVQGGSEELAKALLSYFVSLGGKVQTRLRVTRLQDVPKSRVVLFDLAPKAVASIAGDALPARYLARLGRYDYGPAVFKLDYALSQTIPWKDPNCARASTVHLGGTFEEIAASEAAVWRGEVPERPYVLLCQQSHFDATRAPAGQHTLYAYCHVPPRCSVDATAQIEAQIERFAPGFRDIVLARHKTTPSDFEAHNPSFVGGAITGGAAHLTQLFTRPVARLDPYSTPNPHLFMCSHSTPPGGGIHGMCGFHAAESALRRLRRGIAAR